MSKRVYFRYFEATKEKNELKQKFKKVVRQVIINSHWLDGTSQEKQGKPPFSVYADRDISLLVRTKRKSGMLTANDKSVLRTPHYLRTVADRKKLCMLFAGLKCFRTIPPILRARLVPYIKLMSINAGRMVFREFDEPHMVMFIVSGEIEMAKNKFVKATNSFESEGKIMFGPGDCIGELEMTEGCLRIHTFIARSQCEILAVFGNDFETTLKPHMQKVWNEKKRAIKALNYFDFFNEEQLLCACKMSTLKQFRALDTIYSQDKGTLTNVHFVLSGECVILQCLDVKVDKCKGKKVYTLVDTMDDNNLSEDSDNEIRKYDGLSLLSLISNEEENDGNKKKRFGKLNLQEIEALCGLESQASMRTYPVLRRRDSSQSNSSGVTSAGVEEIENEEEQSCNQNYTEEFREDASSSSNSFYMMPRTNIFEGSIENILMESKVTDDEDLTESDEYAKDTRFASKDIMDSIESHFIDVASITFGGIFGLGEKIENRVVMARSTVQCLILPRFFLLDKDYNPGNIWQRRVFYLDCLIPTREMLFNDFLKNVEWKKFKTNFVNKHLKPIINDVTTIDDIPILCRIDSGLDDY